MRLRPRAWQGGPGKIDADLHALTLAYRLEVAHGAARRRTRTSRCCMWYWRRPLSIRPQSSRRSIRVLQPRAFAIEPRDAGIHGFRIRTAERQSLGEQPDRRERRAELVRHLRYEVALQLGQVRLAPHEHPDQAHAGDRRTAQAPAPRYPSARSARPRPRNSSTTPRASSGPVGHDHQAHQEQDDAAVAEGGDIAEP